LRLLKNIGAERDEKNIVEDFLCDAILEEEIDEKNEVAVKGQSNNNRGTDPANTQKIST